MISDEIRNGIKAKFDIHELKIIAGIKKGNNIRIGRETPALRKMYDLNETWLNKQNI